MGMATAKFTELPLRTTLPFASHYPSSSSPSPSSLHFFFHSSSNSLSHQKPTFSLLLKPFCSLSTTSQDPQKPSQNPSNSPLKPKPTSTTHWLNKWTSGHPQNEPNVRALNPRAVNSKSESRAETRVFDGAAKTSAIERIVLRLRNLGLGSDDEDEDGNGVISAMPVTGEEKLGDLLRRDWVRPDTILAEDDKENETVLPWERGEDGTMEVEEDGRVGKKRTVKAPTLAELTIEDSELRRLRRLGMTIRERISVAKAGVTGEVLEKIHDKWRKCELVRLKFHESLANDMKTAHEIVERRTGGLVVWRSGSVMVVYRGSSYEGPSSRSQPINREGDTLFVPDVSSADNSQGKDDSVNAYILDKSKPVLPVRVENMSEEEAEYNSLLDGLGPRFEDWWGTGVLPVDADLLPQTVPGYRTPFRLLPTRMRSCLTNAEMTNLRKLAKSLPCHFALGRNRNHQGLAAAIVKLWEKSLVAKIAVKRGVQNTNNKLMSEELKLLTGGVLLLRNKYYIVIYRGKDFLPTSVATALAERQEMTKKIQDVEEQVRRGATVATPVNEDGQALAGTLAEFHEAQARWGREISAEERQKMVEKSSLDKRARVVKQLEHKLAIAQAKKLKAERLLSKIVSSWVPVGPSDDQETITDEERVMYRRVGLRMKAYLPLGIRGVFDGVIENMHLHWKHRELVKLISKEKELALVEETARLLEYESEGILVAIERVPKGYALIYYRGKNYRRPITLRPRNLLTKAKALKRRVALQRYEALSQHISELEKTIQQTKLEIGNSQDVENTNTWDSNGHDHFSKYSDISQSEDEASWLGSDDDEEEYFEEGKDSEYTGVDNHDQVSSVTAL